jgi:hypothetical protein
MALPGFLRRFPRSALVVGSIAVLLAALTLIPPNPASLADPQAPTPTGNIPFPGELDKQIARLNNGTDSDKKKGYILQFAKDNLPFGGSAQKGFQSKAFVSGLRHPSEYGYNPFAITDIAFFPGYFAKPFNNLPASVHQIDAGHYDYKNDRQIWVDFANHKLGGGIFGDGMVQEETMAASMPELANAAAVGYDTRTAGTTGPLKSGDPTPLLFKDIQRSIALDNSTYRDGWKKYSLAEYKDPKHKPLLLTPQNPNQIVDILAVAVPKLEPGTPEQQTSVKTLDDLFNTLVAAYTLVKDDLPNATINTGAIGTGDFNNDKTVVYVMQHLALQQVGLSVNYWGLDSATQKTYGDMVHKIMTNWSNAKDKTVYHLMDIAHDCLTKQASCA